LDDSCFCVQASAAAKAVADFYNSSWKEISFGKSWKSYSQARGKPSKIGGGRLAIIVKGIRPFNCERNHISFL
jgi:hypothetical protein